MARLRITIRRPSNELTAVLFPPGPRPQAIHSNDIISLDGGRISLANPDRVQIDFTVLYKMCAAVQNSLYIGPFRNAINIGTGEQYFDIQVGQAFVRAWKDYKTGTVRSQNEAAYRLSEEIGKIFDFERLEINPSVDEQTLQIFLNGKSYKLNEVGSGLTQFVIVLANAAIRKPSYILIDEPELHLHPSLQIDFLTTLTSYATEGVLFSTHNIGLARSSAERVYAARRVRE